MLGTEELERYARHIVLREVGGPGQTKLKAARVLVVGAGGLGAPVLLYLAAAGVGTVGVVDDDDVSLSNLQRQIIFATADIGRPKVGSLRRYRKDPIAGQCRDVDFCAHRRERNRLISRYDIGRRLRYSPRVILSDARYFARKPLVTAAVGTFDGTLTSDPAHDAR